MKTELLMELWKTCPICQELCLHEGDRSGYDVSKGGSQWMTDKCGRCGHESMALGGDWVPDGCLVVGDIYE